jgi:putative addiction module component (TIGR02574 family)
VTPQSQQVLREALALPPINRVERFEQILASFEFPARKDIDAAWAEEAESRIDAYEKGEISSTPADGVFQEIDQQAQR